MALPTGLSNALLIPLCGGRPLLRRQEGTILTRPALAAVVGPEDRRAQQDLQAGEVAQAEVLRPVPDQVVVGVAVVQAAVQAGVEEAAVEAELSPVHPRALQLPNLPYHLRLVALEGMDAPSNKVSALAHARRDRLIVDRIAAELSRKSDRKSVV